MSNWKKYRRSLGLALVTTLFAAGCAATIDSDEGKEDVGSTAENRRMSFEEFKSSLFQEPDTGIYIVEGDLPISGEQKLREYYEANMVNSQALAVNSWGILDGKWDDDEAIRIRYCIWPLSFAQHYETVVNAMREATAGWENVARVNFIYRRDQDPSCTSNNENVVFNVRRVFDAPYDARAFFPGDSRDEREILINDVILPEPSSALTLAGILRHELGHALGFRHEHARLEANPQGSCKEDRLFRTLTPYDRGSVMHYKAWFPAPFNCGGAGQDYVLSSNDRQGAFNLYGFALPQMYCGPDGGVCGSGYTCWDDKCEPN